MTTPSRITHPPSQSTAQENHPSLAVIILAAGASSRMGRPKLLLPWQNTTIVGHLISQWRELGTGQIAIVLRENDTALASELDRLKFPKADRILNPQPERGMFSSIVCAVNWTGWQKNISRWTITLGDQPHLRTETLQKLLDFSALHEDAICQPAFGGRTVHPVILPRRAFEALKIARVENLKEFLKSNVARSVHIEINDPGLVLDLDTPEDYLRAQSPDNATAASTPASTVNPPVRRE